MLYLVLLHCLLFSEGGGGWSDPHYVVPFLQYLRAVSYVCVGVFVMTSQ